MYHFPLGYFTSVHFIIGDVQCTHLANYNARGFLSA